MSDSRYLIPGVFKHRVSETIRKSRFIGSLGPAASPEEAQLFIESIKSEFPDASHNCWAFAAGPPGDTARLGCSDDGEPHNTAGRPMLQTLLHSDIGEVVVVVSRYFGGIKLGTGGLVRAYSLLVKKGLETLPLVERVEKVRFRVILKYSWIDPMKQVLPDHEAVIVEESFGADAAFVLELPVERQDDIIRALNDLSRGSLLVESEPPHGQA